MCVRDSLSLSGCKMNKTVWTNLADAVLQNRTLERLVCKDTACDVRLFEEVLSHWCAPAPPPTHSLEAEEQHR
jgi:hypothetical protein